MRRVAAGLVVAVLGLTAVASAQEAQVPDVELSGAKRQRVLHKGGLAFAITCDAPCHVGIGVAFRIGRRTYSVPPGEITLEANVRQDLGARFPAPARKALRKALRTRRSVPIVVAVSVDGAGEDRERTFTFHAIR